jgi:hypothetical protein
LRILYALGTLGIVPSLAIDAPTCAVPAPDPTDGLAAFVNRLADGGLVPNIDPWLASDARGLDPGNCSSPWGVASSPLISAYTCPSVTNRSAYDPCTHG